MEPKVRAHARYTHTLRTHVTHARYARCPRGGAAQARPRGTGAVLRAAVVFIAVSLSSPCKSKEVKTLFNETRFAKRTH